MVAVPVSVAPCHTEASYSFLRTFIYWHHVLLPTHCLSTDFTHLYAGQMCVERGAKLYATDMRYGWAVYTSVQTFNIAIWFAIQLHVLSTWNVI